MAMLEVTNLSIQFGGLRAVDNFNLKIEKGELYGLIEPTVPARRRYSTCSPVCTSPIRVLSAWMGQTLQAKAQLRSIRRALPVHFRISVCFQE